MRLLLPLFIATLTFALEVGIYPETVVLEGDKGAKVTGEPFTTASLKEKVHVLFYVDPDEKELNEHVVSALKAEAFDRSLYASVAVINMDATWLPNFAIASMLAKKQEEFPHTIYVKDLQKVLLKAWDLEDDSSNVLLFDKRGKSLFTKKGKLSEEEVRTLITLIKENI